MATNTQTSTLALSHRTRGRLQQLVQHLPSYAILILWSGFTLFAIGWIAMSSLKGTRELFQEPLALPQEPRFENYDIAWNAVDMSRYFVNSVIVVSISV